MAADNSETEETKDATLGENDAMEARIVEICEKLSAAPNHILVFVDLDHAMSHYGTNKLKNLVKRLAEHGFVETFLARIDGEARPLKCLRLLKEYKHGDYGNMLKQDQLMGKEPDDEPVEMAVVKELPIDYQLFRFIDDAPAEGITQPELWHLSGLNRKTCSHKCNRLIEQYGVQSIAETSGKNMIYRLYTKSKLEASSAMQAKVENLNQHKDSVDVAKKRTAMTTTRARRRTFVLDLLQSKKVITVSALKQQLITFEKELNIDYLIDMKSTNRLVDTLVKEKLAKMMAVSVPLLSGSSKTVNLILLPSLEVQDPVVQEFIATLRESEVTHRSNTKVPLAKPEVITLGQVTRLTSTDTSESEPKNPGSKVALTYGYIPAKMLRVKLLHQFLWQQIYGKLTEEPAEEPKRENFMWNDIIRVMPIKIYLQVIGHAHPIEGIEQCIAQGTTIEQAPDSVRHALFNRRVFTYKLNLLTSTLKELNLISSESNNVRIATTSPQLTHRLASPFGKDSKYGWSLLYLTISAILDTTASPTSTTRNYTFDTLTDVMRYWSELEFISLHQVLEEETDESSVKELSDLQNPHNWKAAKQITRGQRVLLDKCNPEAKELSESEIRTIARQCFVSASQAIYYYKRKRKSMEKQQETKKKRHLVETEEGEQEEVPLKRRRKNRLVDIAQGPEHVKAFQEKQKKSSAETSNDNESEDDAASDEDTDEVTKATTPPVGPHRRRWRALEDANLLQLFMQLVSEDESSAWTGWDTIATKLDKTVESCYRRYKYLMRVDKHRNAVQAAFAERSATAQDPSSVRPLPDSLQQLHKHFVVKELTLDKPLHPSLNKLGVLPEFIKMILLVPEAQYDSQAAAAVLKKFPESAIRECFQELHNAGIIVKNKQSASVRAYQLSNKFHKYMDSLPLHPQVFEEATKWRVQLQDGNERELAPFASGGTIAQTLAMLAEGLIQLTPIISNEESIPPPKKHNNVHYWGVDADIVLPEWKITIQQQDNDGYRLGLEDNGVEHQDITSVLHKEEPLSESESTMEDYLRRSHCTTVTAELADNILTRVKRAQQQGLSVAELQGEFPSCGSRELDEALTQLINFSLVCRVMDSASHRFVAAEFAGVWNPCFEDENRERVDIIWSTVSGEINSAFLMKCKKKLLSEVMRSPGISKCTLIQQASPMLSVPTIEEVLRLLEVEGLVYSKSFPIARSSLFSRVWQGTNIITPTFPNNDFDGDGGGKDNYYFPTAQCLQVTET